MDQETKSASHHEHISLALKSTSQKICSIWIRNHQATSMWNHYFVVYEQANEYQNLKLKIKTKNRNKYILIGTSLQQLKGYLIECFILHFDLFTFNFQFSNSSVSNYAKTTSVTNKRLWTTFTPQIKGYSQCVYQILQWLWNVNKEYKHSIVQYIVRLTVCISCFLPPSCRICGLSLGIAYTTNCKMCISYVLCIDRVAALWLKENAKSSLKF